MINNKLPVAIGLIATTFIAIADEETTKSYYGWTPSATITLANDYIWRGVSQTSNGATIQGSFDMNHESGIYFGAWASNVEFGDTDNSMELDLYAGFSNEIKLGSMPLTYDIGFLHYEYPEETGLNFNEIYFGVGISPFENFNFSAYYFQDIGVESKPGIGYLDMSADYTLPDFLWNLQIIAHGGHYWRRAGATWGHPNSKFFSFSPTKQPSPFYVSGQKERFEKARSKPEYFLIRRWMLS